jgi:hypothetical protein
MTEDLALPIDDHELDRVQGRWLRELGRRVASPRGNERREASLPAAGRPQFAAIGERLVFEHADGTHQRAALVLLTRTQRTVLRPWAS